MDAVDGFFSQDVRAILKGIMLYGSEITKLENFRLRFGNISRFQHIWITISANLPPSPEPDESHSGGNASNLAESGCGQNRGWGEFANARKLLKPWHHQRLGVLRWQWQ